MRARLAAAADVEAILRICNERSQDRSAAFESRPSTEADVRAWFDGAHPIVAVEDEADGVVAVATTSEYRRSECYRGVYDVAVFVAATARRRGAGKVALHELVIRARNAGAWKLVGQLFVDNAAGRALARALGFREVGTYYRHGKVNGVWRDVVVVEKFLAPLGAERGSGPPPPRPARERIIDILRSEPTPERLLAALDAASAIVEEQGKPDRELVEAGLSAFFGAGAREPATRSSFVRLFRAAAGLAPEEARHLSNALFARLGQMSVALDLSAFYETTFVVKQTLGASNAPELAAHLPELVEWIKQATDLPRETRGRISPANLASLLMSLAIAGCTTDAERLEIAGLAANAKARLNVAPPASIRPAALAVDRISPLAHALSEALAALTQYATDTTREAASSALAEFLGSDEDVGKLAEAAQKEEWDDARLACLVGLFDVVPPLPPSDAARALLTALAKPRSRTPGQVLLRKQLAQWKPKKASRKAAKRAPEALLRPSEPPSRSRE